MILVDLSISLDGYAAGPRPTLEEPLGAGGEALHEWAFGALKWREQHGLEGGADDVDSEEIERSVDGVGASIMGRRMFSGGSGPWDADPRSRGWWGDDPPFHHPVFVLTHHAREPLELGGGTTFHFVTDGPEAALELARAAAGGGHVRIAGGAQVAQQYLRLGVVDEVALHVGLEPARWERISVTASERTGVAHLRYRV
jgi:dihydrofolate reductase